MIIKQTKVAAAVKYIIELKRKETRREKRERERDISQAF